MRHVQQLCACTQLFSWPAALLIVAELWTARFLLAVIRAMVRSDPINIMVVGECGDGKSTLINGLRDPHKSEQALTGKNARGVTKSIVLYPCLDLGGRPFNLWDTPGVGDHDVTPLALLSMIEEILTAGMVPGGMRGLIVTTPIPDGRIKLGAQIVQAIVDKGFVAADGDDKYANIILCGTKLDKADDEEVQNFIDGIDGGVSVRSLFFKQSRCGQGPCAMVSHKDYSPLLEEIRKLPASSIAFEKPELKVMAEALAEKLGMKPEDMENEMKLMRQMVEEQSKQMRELLHQMREDQIRHQEDMARKDQQMQEMVVKMQEDQKRAENARAAREHQLEVMRQQQDAQRREEAAQAAKVQEKLMEQMQEESRRAREQFEDMQRSKAEAEQQHRQFVQEMQRNSERAIEAARQSRGGGCVVS